MYKVSKNNQNASEITLIFLFYYVVCTQLHQVREALVFTSILFVRIQSGFQACMATFMMKFSTRSRFENGVSGPPPSRRNSPWLTRLRSTEA